MSWNIAENEKITIARLMAASPEYVHEQLKYLAENIDDRLATSENLERALLGRNNNFINLALALYAKDDETLKWLYLRTVLIFAS
jgi:hypothetical protein